MSLATSLNSRSIELLPATFVASEAWNDRRIRALAMYCSDGRWGDAFDELCHCRLHIPRYDRFALPGGPAWLTERPASGVSGANLQAHAAWEQLALLVRAHEIQRIVLISHYGCAYYLHRLDRDADGCLPFQIEDLKRAADAVQLHFPHVCVESFMAMRDDSRMSFHRVV
jgi:hypothetical protein